MGTNMPSSGLVVLEIDWYPGGVLTYLAERGCAALMGRFFTRNPQTWVLFFTQKILKHGSTFLIEPQITWFWGKNPENRGIFWKIGLFLKENP